MFAFFVVLDFLSFFLFFFKYIIEKPLTSLCLIFQKKNCKLVIFLFLDNNNNKNKYLTFKKKKKKKVLSNTGNINNSPTPSHPDPATHTRPSNLHIYLQFKYL